MNNRIKLPQIASIAAIWLLSSCSGNNGNNSTVSAGTIPKDSMALPGNNDVAAEKDTVQYDDTRYPVDTELTASLLTPGIFHHDEVDCNAAQQSWTGLFRNAMGGYYLARANISVDTAFDVVVDEDPKLPTGWKVTAINKDSTIFMVSSLSYLKAHAVHPMNNIPALPPPGDTIRFSFQDGSYYIYATGGKRKMPNSTEVDVYNYKAYLGTNKNGRTVTSLLLASPVYYNGSDVIIFAGDLDGDGLLDIFMDSSGEDNMESPTLYLSSPAGMDESIKAIAMHSIVGC